MSRRDRGIALAIAAVVLASRLPFVTRLLWEWDSVLYARALERGFHVAADLAEQRPHPPGYPFYVGVASLFRAAFGDSNAALVAVSVVASALAAAAVYLLARRFARAELAAFAALAFAFDPLVWALSEEAMPYLVLALGSVTLAALFWDARGDGARALGASVVLGIAAGFRADLLLLFAPLWLWIVLPRGPRVAALSALAVAAASALWAVPAALASGGPGAYAQAVLAQSASITAKSSIAAGGGDALSYNVRFTVLALAEGLGPSGALGGVLLLAAALRWIRTGGRRVGAEAVFFALWVAPALLVYTLWIIGEWGYVLSIVPAIYVLVAVLLERALRQAPRGAWSAWRAAAAVIVLAAALGFLALPGRFTAQALARHDAGLADRTAYVREHFAPERTVLLAREDFTLAQYYLPGYRAWLYLDEPATPADPPKDAGGAAVLVVFTPSLELRQPVALATAALPSGDTLRSADLGAGAIRLFGAGDVARER